MSKRNLFLGLYLVALAACGGQSATPQCETNEILVGDKCQVACATNNDCFTQHGGGWQCLDGYCQLASNSATDFGPARLDVPVVDRGSATDTSVPDTSVPDAVVADESMPDVPLVDVTTDVGQPDVVSQTDVTEVVTSDTVQPTDVVVVVDVASVCVAGARQLCGTSNVGVCRYGSRTCQSDGTWWGPCIGAVDPSPEKCNGLDDDCDGHVPVVELDSDKDGYRSCENDCDDTNSNVHPGAQELCNGVDDDCDGQTDELFFVKVPCLGKGACGQGVYECAGLNGFVCSTMPGGSADQSSVEVCGNNIDDDCNGQVDDGVICKCDPEDTKDCGSSNVGVCHFGKMTCNDDGTWGVCEGAVEPSSEVCNGLDDDCNGQIPSNELDSDRDGYRVCAGDCDDTNPNINPGRREFCDGVDEDCNGSTDDGYYVGVPCHGVGACGYGVYECAGLNAFVCSTMPGGSADMSKTEICGNNIDDDCNGQVDDGAVCACDPGNERQCGSSNIGVCHFGLKTCGLDGKWLPCVGAVEPSPEVCNGLDDDCDNQVPVAELDKDADGYRGCQNDCDDTNPNVNPGRREFCDGVDENCNGITDDGFYIGVPCQGKGDCGQGVYECAGLNGYVCSTMPGGSADMSKSEICGNNVDDDCNGQVDETCDCDPLDTKVCGSHTLGVCREGTMTCGAEGQWGPCVGAALPSPEVCNGLDDDCDGQVPNTELDSDRDGYRICEGDCDDSDAKVHPGAVELCNWVDENCNGRIDEPFYVNTPCYGRGACNQLGHYECDGENAFRCSTNPGGSEDKSSAETCYDFIDNDCDGTVNENCICFSGNVQVCGTNNLGQCKIGLQTCDENGEWGACGGSREPSVEACNGLDDDCDGTVPSNESDNDHDGYPVCDGDCDDTNPNIHPGAAELCNGVDDNCNGQTDESFFVGVPCFGRGACDVLGHYECSGLKSFQCSTNPGGSDDRSSPELCNDFIDNNCDGSVNETCDCLTGTERPCGSSTVGVCKIGTQLCSVDGKWLACVGSVEPSVEVCNGQDDNCDGNVPGSENDSDNDGYRICDGDCDDTNANIHPGAAELCNGVDDNCDGQVDESFFVGVPCFGRGACDVLGHYECSGLKSFQCSTNPGGSDDRSSPELCNDFIDNNCDGSVNEKCDCLTGTERPCGSSTVGVCKIGTQLCSVDGKWLACVGSVEPSAEVCNGLDDNCDGTIPDSELDQDNDGFRICAGDCADANANVYPGAPERCNGLDDNCNGQVDENFFVGVPCRGVGACGTGVYECADLFSIQCNTMPGASHDMSRPEDCNDLVDNDCEGTVNEGCDCLAGVWQPCGSSDVGVCTIGIQRCDKTGKWGTCFGNVEPSPEVCNGLDDDCDGVVPQSELDWDNDWVMVCAGDCNDEAAGIHPGQPEICDGIDQNCDGQTDEVFFVGVPCRGIGACVGGVYECAGSFDIRCSTMPGGSEDESSPEKCNDLIDNDCDNTVNEGCACFAGNQRQCGSSSEGECQLGWQLCGTDGTWKACVGSIEPIVEKCNGLDDDCDGNVPVNEVDFDNDGFRPCDGDCDDANAVVFPNNIEKCNGFDDNCDGVRDEGCSAITCNICCGFGLGAPILWYGDDHPVFVWTPGGSCGTVVMTEGEICQRGGHPQYPKMGYVDFNCVNGTVYGGWTPADVLGCSELTTGATVNVIVQPGTVDPRGEAEIIFSIINMCQ